MKPNSMCIRLGCLALLILVSLDVHAQDEHYFLQSMEALKPLRHKQDDNEARQTKSSKGAQNLEVARNIDRNLEEIALLRGRGKSEAEISRALVVNTTSAGTGSIEGILYQSDGISPVSLYMSVGAYNEFGVYAGYGYALYSNGVYQIQNLPTGNYYVQLNWSGVGDVIPVYYNDVEDWRQATLVHVNDGLPTTDIDFVCRQRQVQGGAIAGTVFSADSNRLVQCSVTAHDPSNTMTTWGAVTDSLGRYVIKGMSPGDYRIRAYTYSSGGYLPQWYEHAGTFETATVIHVPGTDTIKGKDFYLDLGGSISGVVIAEEGGSIPENACNILIFDTEMNQVASSQNTSTGAFDIPGLPTGDYTLEFRYYGMENYANGWYDRASQASQATLIHVTAPEKTAITILLQRGGVIAGTTTFASTMRSGVSVFAYDEQGVVVQQASSDQNGVYAVSGLSAGRYKVLASTVRGSGYGGPQPLDQWYSQAADFTHGAFVDVRKGDTTRSINFNLLPGGSIVCQVVDRFGVPLSSGMVYLCDARGARIRSASVLNGNCAFGGLISGQYKLFFSSPRSSEYASEWLDGKNSAQDAALITVTAPGSTKHVNFTLQPAGSLGGYVTDATGTRIPDRLISVVLFDAVTGGYVGTTQTSFVGGFQDMFLPGIYKIGLFSQNVNTRPPVEDSLAAYYYEHGRRFTDAGSTPVTIGGSDSVKLNDCVMDRTTGSIAGTVYNRETGKPLTSGVYLVFAFDEEGRPAAVTSYSSQNAPITGEYTLRGLWPGKYYLLVVGIISPSDAEYARWYDGVAVDVDSVMFVPMPAVPNAARIVTVGAGRTVGIDFHVGTTTEVPPGMQMEVPQAFRLSQNYPNPFNPSTTIRYGLSSRSHVIISVFNTLGQMVAVLQNGEMDAGYHDVKFDAANLSSGLYFYRLQAGTFVETKRLLLLR